MVPLLIAMNGKAPGFMMGESVAQRSVSVLFPEHSEEDQGRIEAGADGF